MSNIPAAQEDPHQPSGRHPLEDHFLAAIERLSQTDKAWKMLAAAITATIPRQVQEWAQDLTNGGSLTVNPMTQSWERIDFACWVVPNLSGATLQLGNDFAMPLGTGFGQVGPGLGRILRVSDPRKLIVGTPGIPGSFLFLSGQVLTVPHHAAT